MDAQVTGLGEPQDLVNKSVVKAMGLLTAMGRFPEGVTVTDLAREVRQSRPTVFRLLLSLIQTGFAEKYENKYHLGWKLAHLGRLADPNGGIMALIQPVLEGLAEELNEMVGYAVVNGDADFDLVAEATSARLLTLSQGYVGKTFPLHASATGKTVLAELSDEAVCALLPQHLPRMSSRTITTRSDLLQELDKVRRQQFAWIDDELEEILFSLAVPVRSSNGTLIGVLSATGPSPRMKRRSPEDLAATLRERAMAIAARLAGR